ncbi:hypothetical protein [Streptomyces sp. cmx-4-9]|uniref:hypothetical protein n=1 Tax=Streptomyces sp. cmx-4-9 TaxID=2790941 RepID=UPI00398100D0
MRRTDEVVPQAGGSGRTALLSGGHRSGFGQQTLSSPGRTAAWSAAARGAGTVRG